MPKAVSTKSKKNEAQLSMPEGRVGKYFYSVGRRKTAVATVRLYENGKGDFTINGEKVEKFINSKEFEEILYAPLRAVKAVKAFDISAHVKGGGVRSQIDAVKHAISRALTLTDPLLRPTLKKIGYLTRDPRMKERKKPGLKRARKAPQWSKR